MSKSFPKHLELLIENIAEIERLLRIQNGVTGGITRRQYNVETLNASCIVLLVACWESYVEDVVNAAFDILLDNAYNPLKFPVDVRLLASKELKESKDERKVWNLAGDGWRKVLVNYKNEQIKSFNTPKPENIDRLCKRLIDIQKISREFRVPRMKNSDVCEQLDALIKLRGSIAHRVKANKPVTKKTVEQHIRLIGVLAENMNNIINDQIKELTGSEPWGHIQVAI